MRTYLIYTLLILFSIVWYGCPKKACDESGIPSKYYYIDSNAKTKVKYTGHDTLKFFDPQFGPLTFIGQGNDSGYTYHNNVWECSGEYQYLEYNQMRYKCTDSTKSAPITVRLKMDLNKSSQNALLEVEHYKRFSIMSNLVGSLKIDSVIIYGHTYFNVTKIYGEYDSHREDEKNVVYYTPIDGIVRIIINGDTINKIPN